VKASELELDTLLEAEGESGRLWFAGQRVLLLDAVALGLLRKQLIDTVGFAGARAVLTRFGYAHGWRTAEAMREAFPWDSETDWRQAGGHLHRIQGMVRFEPKPHTDEAEADPPFADALWHDSYEAEQHLLHQGACDEPVCWTLCGFASGYLSCSNGREIFCVETQCVAAGASVCEMVGRPKAEWAALGHPVVSWHDADCLDGALRSVTQALKTAEARLKRAQKAEPGAADEDGVVARSDAMRRAVALALRLARVDSSVLITGESGTGKEVIARLIHRRSPRAARPFLAVNCGAIPEQLMEPEFFGHIRGAFTGASGNRLGYFEATQGGTLLLDEIGELPLAMQAKLLRVLQEREVRRVGETESRPVDVRVLAATNRDLAADVKAGRFREDLLFRLNVVPLPLPPLRERPEDVLPLAQKFLEELGPRVAPEVKGFSPQAVQALQRQPWPGNVRELRNAVEHALVLATGPRLQPEDFPVAAAPGGAGGAQTLEAVEKAHILATLHAHGGHRERAAASLGIGAATLYRKLKAYGA
jgi:DNA-binding NtrC family response regulator